MIRYKSLSEWDRFPGYGQEFTVELFENEVRPERALSAAVDTGEYDVEASMTESYELIRSAGAEPFGSMAQRRPPPDSATCVGFGTAEDTADYCTCYEIDLLIFDCEPLSIQICSLDELIKACVIDRTVLIFNISAARVKSKEGRPQVESAQLRYLLPCPNGKGIAVSRLGGGIDTRDPGETKFEIDHWHVRRRIKGLKEQLGEVEKHREQINRRRQKDGVITVALVGYTNARKSTLMNHLTQTGVLAKDQLLATFDPAARVLRLPSGVTAMLIDTVGFVRRLLHRLVSAFRSTLEQAALTDLILNVCDVSSPEAQTYLEVTRALLAELGWKDRPVISVLDRCNLVPELGAVPIIGNAVCISAVTGVSIDELLETVERNLPVRTVQVEAFLPLAESGLAVRVCKDDTLQEEEFMEHGLRIVARVGPELLEQLPRYLVGSDKPED